MNTTTPMGMLQQPRPFFMIFFVELWERFGYYGVQGVLAVFFVKQLGFSQEQAFVTFGAFAALVYGLISIGGYVGDHLLGTKRTIVLGALVLAIGYFMTGMSLLKPDLIFIALGTIAVGNGLFKANPASLLSKCYPPKDPRLDGAFTLFYMSINIGSLIALSLAPVIADKFGYSVTYNLCGTRWRGSVPETTMISVRPPPPRCGPAQRTHLLPVTVRCISGRQGRPRGQAVLRVLTLKPDNGRRGRMKPPMWCRAGDRVTVRCGSPTSG